MRSEYNRPPRPEDRGGRSAPVFRRLETLSLALEILWLYARARWRIRHEPDIRQLVSMTRGHAERRRRHAGERGPEARRLARAVSRTLTALPTDDRCLVRSLVLLEMLSRRGLDSTLVIGTRSLPEFSAHAWLELAGQPLTAPGEHSGGRLAEL